MNAYGKAVRSRGFKPLAVFMEEISPHSRKEGFTECSADAVADCLVNKENSAFLAKSIWQHLKGEEKMIAYSELEMRKFNKEEISKYGLFDNRGFLVGVKDDAPAEFKTAYDYEDLSNV